jgi:molecular chaperone DnaK (HSP70)
MTDALAPLFIIGASLAAILGAYGYRGREEQIVGIDLGTTFSVVAVKRRETGVEVIRDHLTRKPVMPSMVSYLQNGTVLVGDEAVAHRSANPMQTVFNSKRFIGRPYDEVHESIDASEHPVQIVNGTNLPKVKGRLSGARFKVDVAGKEVLVSPEEVGTHIVKRLGVSVEKSLGWAVSRAVICVPAKFSGVQRRSTQHAFEQAGIKVMRIMDEPTAAAVAYNLDLVPEPRNILVYDIGGGTLDTSLLFMNGDSIKQGKHSRGTITPLATDGDDHLGGADFDQVMFELLRDRLETADASSADAQDLVDCDETNLRIQAEFVKKQLSSQMHVEFRCRQAGGRVKAFAVTREQYEDRSKHLFDRAIAPVQRVLEEVMMQPDDVHHVVLVGGASRMPKLRELLREFFGEAGKIRHDIDPDLTVAWGAANIVD